VVLGAWIEVHSVLTGVTTDRALPPPIQFLNASELTAFLLLRLLDHVVRRAANG
jgi:hypothetical protein